MANVYIMDHPLIQHKIGLIRKKETGTKDFRQTISEIAMLICYEATRELQVMVTDELRQSMRQYEELLAETI